MANHTFSAVRSSSTAVPFDHTALRFNQTVIIIFTVSGFVINQWWLVAFVGAMLALGTAFPRVAPFQRLYSDLLRPRGLLRPDVREEDPAPHRFAQGLGATMLLIASSALLAGFAVIGWGLALVVAALAAVNLFFGFCAGCFVYLQIERLRR